MLTIYDKLIALLVTVLCVGGLTFALVLEHFERHERREFKEYMQQKGYVQLELHGQVFLVPLQTVPETTQIVKEYLEATKQVE